ncbi:aromatic-L-amino-acid decarboxylase-like isoform X5 [Tachypleus tridentatus]|uniref:aromatic-L-amino-acid decarboxylase-like isoform X5 n=1 Tax=Tachypleus tridentatus TaxID=6853 RepID=UPI003FCF26D7
MDTEEFRLYGKQMVDFMADYMHNIRNHRVLPQISPGYVRDLVPEQAPEEGEPWEEVFKDIQRVVLPGVVHWNSPRFHSYFPAGNSFPAICAEMLSGVFCNIGFSWSASPASTDLEMVMLDWLGKMVQLPQEFLFSSNGPGGGVVQSSASESTLMALLSAREKAISYVQSIKKDLSQGIILEKMVYYSSIEAHCSVEKAGLLSGLTCRLLPTDAAFSLQGDILQAAIDEDRTQGKIPFFVVGTLGTTNSCAFDNIEKLGEVCKKENLWFHIDAAYAGAAFICPEFRYLLNGVEHWGIPCGRKFRSLKMWFVFRLFGVRGLQTYIRKHVRLAHEFENLARNDNRFEVLFPVVLGVVCFRLKGSEVQNEEMLRVINKRGKIALKSSRMRSHNLYFIRFVVCGKDTESEDIVFSWREISLAANNVLNPKVVGDKSETF